MPNANGPQVTTSVMVRRSTARTTSSAGRASGTAGRLGNSLRTHPSDTDLPLELVELLLPYARDPHEVLDRREGPVGLAVLHDGTRRSLADARERLELVCRGKVDVHERARVRLRGGTSPLAQRQPRPPPPAPGRAPSVRRKAPPQGSSGSCRPRAEGLPPPPRRRSRAGQDPRARRPPARPRNRQRERRGRKPPSRRPLFPPRRPPLGQPPPPRRRSALWSPRCPVRASEALPQGR